MTVAFFLIFMISTQNIGSAEKAEARLANKVKSAIADLGIGKNAYVEIKLKDKTEMKGYVKNAGSDSFILINSRTGENSAIPYPAVKKLKAHNLSTDEKVLIGIGVTAAALFLALYIFVD